VSSTHLGIGGCPAHPSTPSTLPHTSTPAHTQQPVDLSGTNGPRPVQGNKITFGLNVTIKTIKTAQRYLSARDVAACRRTVPVPDSWF
jgi:hypothetical protein